MKKFLTLLCLVLVAFIAVGCKEKEPGKDNGKKFEPVAINTVVTTAKNNDEVQIEGVVFGVVNNGFYVADAKDGRIFVLTGTSSQTQVAVGDKVQITGQFNIVNNFPQVRNVTVKTVEQGKTADVEVSELTVAQVKGLSSTDRVNSYAKVVKLEAILEKNAANLYTLSDREGNYVVVTQASNLTVLDQYLNKEVIIKVIVHNYLPGENTWSVSFAGGAQDIEEKPYNFDDVVKLALEDLNARLPKKIYGVLNLPKSHPLLPTITYSWSVQPNNYVTIDEEGKVQITLDNVDHEITFVVTISDGQNESTKEFKIVSKAIVERTVSELLNDLPEVDMSYVHVKGLVVGIARNQSLTIRSFVIQDPVTKETTTIDFSNTGNYILNDSEEFKAVKIGDMITVKARYRLSGRPTIMNVTEMTILSRDNEYTHDFENAYVLKDLEDFEYFGANYESFNNKLVKFEKPFLNFSTSSTPSDTNWVVLGPDEANGLAGFGTGGTKRRLAFLIACQNESLGDTSWYKLFDIPFVNQPGKQVNGSFYAYALYISDSYIAFLIPDWSCWQFESLTVEKDIRTNIPESIEEGTINLLKNHPKIQGEITWTSSHPNVINPETGEVTPVEELVVVTLIAEYIVDGQVYTIEVVVTVNPKVPLTVSQVLAGNPDGAKVRVKGVIAAYSSDGNDNKTRDGIIILDNQTGDMLLINGLANVNNSSKYGQYYDSEGTLLAIGDEVIIEGTYFADSPAIGSSSPEQTGRRNIVITNESYVKRVSTNNPLNFNFENAIVIDSHDAQQEFADNLQYGVLLKFVGTAERPFYIGGSSSNFPFNVKVFFAEATNNDGTKYNGQTFSLKTDVNIPNAGETWYTDLLGITGPFVGPTTSNPRIPIIGEIYVVVTSRTSTYYQMSIVAPDKATTQRLEPTE